MDSRTPASVAATAKPKSTASKKLRALEKRKGKDVFRGMVAYHDFTRELLGSTTSTKAVISNRVRNPEAITSMEDVEVRLLQWEADLELLKTYESEPSESIRMGILKDMVPESIRQAIRLQKPTTFLALKKVLKDEAKEYRETVVKLETEGT